jgi:hypothetical protein
VFSVYLHRGLYALCVLPAVDVVLRRVVRRTREYFVDDWRFVDANGEADDFVSPNDISTHET